MNFEAQSYYHIYNQGNNSQKIFFEPRNYLLFLKKIRKLPKPAFTVIAYCLMPNHFHFLVYTDFDPSETHKQDQKMSVKIGSLLSSYTKAINKKHDRTGSLFRAGTKSKQLVYEKDPSKSYLSTCFHDIHQNPVRAHLVSQLHDWQYSSYRDYAGYRNGNLPDIEKGMELMEFEDHNQVIQESQNVLDDRLISKIW
jgi:putative transposase